MGRPRKNPIAEPIIGDAVSPSTSEAVEQELAEKDPELTQDEQATVAKADPWKPSREIKFCRDEFALLCGKEYHFNEEGIVDWRKMIDPKYLVPNLSRFPEGTQTKDLNVADLDDSKLLILLGGIKDLAHTRGFNKVEYKVIEATPGYVAVTCLIEWIGNFETDYRTVTFEALADAHIDNSKSFARDFLMATAENRAFTRAVRNFLRINIVGSDEMGDPKKANSSPSAEAPENAISASHPANVLKEVMTKVGVSLEKIKDVILKEDPESGADTWETLTDIPNKTILSLIQRLKKKVSDAVS